MGGLRACMYADPSFAGPCLELLVDKASSNINDTKVIQHFHTGLLSLDNPFHTGLLSLDNPFHTGLLSLDNPRLSLGTCQL